MKIKYRYFLGKDNKGGKFLIKCQENVVFCEKMYNFAWVGENLYTPIYTIILSYYTITFCLSTN